MFDKRATVQLCKRAAAAVELAKETGGCGGLLLFHSLAFVTDATRTS